MNVGGDLWLCLAACFKVCALRLRTSSRSDPLISSYQPHRSLQTVGNQTARPSAPA